MSLKSASTEWFIDFAEAGEFDPWYAEPTDEDVVKQEVDFLIEHLKVKPNALLLDVPCGKGQHARALASRGYKVTGIDISARYLDEAKARCLKDESGAMVQFIQGDMRSLPRNCLYDGGYCLGDSFGYFGFDESEAFLEAISAVLKPDSRLIIDSASVAEVLIPNLKKFELKRSGERTIEIFRQYHAQSSCVESTYRLDGGREGDYKKSLQWVFSTGELTRMLGQKGFNVEAAYKSLDGEDFEFGAARLIIVARKV